ncbi:MAG: hypothetical protein JST54_32760 [Deltaproteobacteria bacterium]|nr:hypothetical protein [Deltaproteobacteria bacterium]
MLALRLTSKSAALVSSAMACGQKLEAVVVSFVYSATKVAIPASCRAGKK